MICECSAKLSDNVPSMRVDQRFGRPSALIYLPCNYYNESLTVIAICLLLATTFIPWCTYGIEIDLSAPNRIYTYGCSFGFLPDIEYVLIIIISSMHQLHELLFFSHFYEYTYKLRALIHIYRIESCRREVCAYVCEWMCYVYRVKR